MIGPALALGVQGYRHRWIADDGLIVTRTVRQILAGNGPVFNVGERAEANTSTLWTFLMTLLASTGLRPDKTAVYTGLLCSMIGLALAIDGTRRWHLARTGTTAATRSAQRWMLPAGCLVVLALPPFWDFATSGLETGLVTAWIGLVWWALVWLDRHREAGWRRLVPMAVLFGLGELVRPDLGLVTAVFGAAAWLLTRPSWPRTLLLAAVAVALPVAYEIFRMGYYGVVVPNTAIAKEAQSSNWHTGYLYLRNFTDPYWLWLPALLLVLALAVAVRHQLTSRAGLADLIVPAAALTAAVLLAFYIVKVGGDFMHGRMLLPAAFCALLPVMVLPYRPLLTPAVVAVAVWAAVCAVSLRVDVIGHNTFADERQFWINATGVKHPATDDAYFRLEKQTPQIYEAERRHVLVYADGLTHFRYAPIAYHQRVKGATEAWVLGTDGAVNSVDTLSIDELGLSYPLSAHQQIATRGRPGHEKWLPNYWVLADYTPPNFTPDGVDAGKLKAARHALSCGALAELQHAVRDPMTLSRFWHNLTGAWRRTQLRYPVDPYAAERKFCR
ncbi:MAG: hypothetical protein ACJ73S_14865 [Mycobacteriales bacterium]